MDSFKLVRQFTELSITASKEAKKEDTSLKVEQLVDDYDEEKVLAGMGLYIYIYIYVYYRR